MHAIITSYIAIAKLCMGRATLASRLAMRIFMASMSVALLITIQGYTDFSRLATHWQALSLENLLLHL